MGHTLAPSQSGTRKKKRDAPFRPRDAYRDVPILQQPTWKHGVAAYFFFGGISSGSYVLGALAELVGNEKQRELAPLAHAVSFVTLLACPPLLMDDLGKPARFYHMLRIFKPSSPMNLGSWTLTTHGVFSTLLALQGAAAAGRIPFVGRLFRALPTRAAAAAGLPTALTLGGYTGVLLGTTSVPVWSTSPLLGGLFMASALATGAAATRLASAIVARDAAHDAFPASVTLVIGTTELALLGGYLATSGQSARSFLRGREGMLLVGAVGASLLGLALDVIGKQSGTQRRLWRGVSAVLTLLSGACLRWSVVLAGHVSAGDREQTLAATLPTSEAPGWGLHRRNG